MTKQDIKKHWKLILAYKEGADIQFKSDTGEWFRADAPLFTATTEYRVKPFNPKIGEIVLFSDNWLNYYKSIYLGTNEEGKYISLSLVEYGNITENNINNYNNLTVASWNYIKPLK